MTSEQLRAARGLLRWSQQQLADVSQVSVPTIKRLEAMDGELSGHASTIASLGRTLEAAGVVFLDDGASADGGPGVRLAKSGAT